MAFQRGAPRSSSAIRVGHGLKYPCCTGETTLTNAYREGIKAAAAGRAFTMNPYPLHTSERHQWFSGHARYTTAARRLAKELLQVPVTHPKPELLAAINAKVTCQLDLNGHLFPISRRLLRRIVQVHSGENLAAFVLDAQGLRWCVMSL